MSAERVFGLEARFFVFSGLDLARAAALQKYREGKGMKRKLAVVLPALVMALLLGLSVFFVACDSGTESGGQNTEQSGEEQEGTEQGGGNEGETGGETGDGGETGEEGDGEGETGGEDPAPVPDVSDKLVFTLNSEKTAYSVTRMDTSAAGSVTIPATYNGLPVTSIGDWAFETCSSLMEITIPEGVTSIGEYAFSGCYNLTEITIPDGVTSIGLGVFSSCGGLNSVSLPESVASIGEVAFSECSSLTEISIPANVTSIGMDAFRNCSSLMEITIPERVTNIGNRAFFGCSSLTGINVVEGNTVYHSEGNCLIETTTKTLILGCQNSVIPTDGSVTSIGSDAFRLCSDLMEIVIPVCVTSIGSSAFHGCYNLKEITIPEGVTSINSGVFSYCTRLTKIKIPAGVTSIGSYAFRGCSGLTEVTIGEGVTSIDSSAFEGCNYLTSVTFENKEGWWLLTSSTATSGTEIASSDLANPATAATYLTSTYDDYYWHRS